MKRVMSWARNLFVRPPVTPEKPGVPHKAIVIGAGRIGAGYGWPNYPYVYTHADTYIALPSRVELAGFVDPDKGRGQAASDKYGRPHWRKLRDALTVKPDIVSICTPPAMQVELAHELAEHEFIKGVWLEKPQMQERWAQHIVVNYIRRYDRLHRMVATYLEGKKSILTVWAKEDHDSTGCHFNDLARWWGSELVYIDNTGEIPGTNSYSVTTGKVTFDFRNGGMTEDGFMQTALGELLDKVEGI